MATRPSLAYQRAVELLADGEWHPFSDLFREVANAVPPNIAFRAAEYHRIWAYQKNNPGKEIKPRKYRAGNDDRLVRIGQRQIARKVLQSKRFERDKERDLIRLRPKTQIPPEEISRARRKAWETRRADPDFAKRHQEMIRKRMETMNARYKADDLYALRSRATHLGRARRTAKALYEEFNP